MDNKRKEAVLNAIYDQLSIRSFELGNGIKDESLTFSDILEEIECLEELCEAAIDIVQNETEMKSKKIDYDSEIPSIVYDRIDIGKTKIVYQEILLYALRSVKSQPMTVSEVAKNLLEEHETRLQDNSMMTYTGIALRYAERKGWLKSRKGERENTHPKVFKPTERTDEGIKEVSGYES